MFALIVQYTRTTTMQEFIYNNTQQTTTYDTHSATDGAAPALRGEPIT